MEYFAKKSDTRVFHRRKQPSSTGESTDHPDLPEISEEDLNSMVNELKFIVPSDQNKPHIVNLWKKTLKFRNTHRQEGTFLMFLNEFPVASAFHGFLIAFDYALLLPKALEFQESWNDIQLKILERYRDMFRFIKHDFMRALAVVRQKNPIRGSKRPRDQQEDKNLRKINPLHGIIEWIKPDNCLPLTHIPLIIVVGENFEEGECLLLWKNVTIPVGNDVLHAFVLLCKVFTVFGVTCSPSDKLFFGFFAAVCMKVEPLSTTANTFVNLL